jgi:hypothetical protein
LPRSGTTLVEQILSSHSRCIGAGEQRASQAALRAVPVAVGRAAAPLECAAALDAAAIRAIATQYLENLQRAAGDQAARVVDKMPDNYLHLGFLATLFPSATFIHCRRDLRDVAVSCWMTDFRMVRWANDAKHIGTRFGEYCRLMDYWVEVLPVRLHEVDYEETVTNLESVARRLRGRKKITCSILSWPNGVVPFAVKLVWLQLYLFQFAVGDPLTGRVFIGIQGGSDFQTRRGARVSD